MAAVGEKADAGLKGFVGSDGESRVDSTGGDHPPDVPTPGDEQYRRKLLAAPGGLGELIDLAGAKGRGSGNEEGYDVRDQSDSLDLEQERRLASVAASPSEVRKESIRDPSRAVLGPP